ncbi:tellurite resistance TerB family protein [Allorhizobium sp. BGMRC 0089]|uniref:tellurite resistance TerB family protein n=1 Tax=Allorhizobium sonneratiae TaxID=2934936 RepID=UPI00203447BE|nr:tellurite resistance TerB family protein [Allorhizobium sonneratiae]MCM2291460.1 tellurite resistance TerB family protein [Allorhizobium sonneratiae]
MSQSVSLHDALIFAMVMASAVDNTMSERELARIGHLVEHSPVFEDFDNSQLISIARRCASMVAGPEGLDITLETIRDALPKKLYDTAYALAVEVASADLSVKPEEIRFLQLLRDRLDLDKLTCAAIERSAIARYRRA